MNIPDGFSPHEELSRPLQFGDPAQILALKMTAPVPIGEGLKRFLVAVEFSGEYQDTVDAVDKEAAIAQVRDEMDGCPDDCEVDISAREMPA